ncbi:MAG: DUF3422 domain-containing protein [Pseudomonadaceae bacterium]|nr:DUF3422 domain-containing protein [Pseudomonadaceae bacterium]
MHEPLVRTDFSPAASYTAVSPLTFHPARTPLFNELHARPFPVLQTPSCLAHLVLLREEPSNSAELQHLQKLCERFAVAAPSAESSCYYQNFGGFELRWERHTEFSTYTLIRQSDTQPLFNASPLTLLPADWLSQLPGQLISALHLELATAPASEPDPESIRQYFEGHRLISSQVKEHKARLWSAYRIHNDGSGRILIHNRELNPCQSGRLVRTLLEMETYRMMLLLALPAAKSIAPELKTMDQQLATVIQQINQIAGLHDERRLLGELSSLAARIEKLISDSNFRFSAAQAYYQLISNRLEELREQEVAGLQTFREFLQRRLTPAWRTCEAVRNELNDLSRRIDRASELLRTRIDLTIEAQNQSLMLKMDQRSHTQLRLQQTVEGLSVAAISYYLVGLTKHLAESAKALGLIDNSALVTGLAVPFCVTAVWLAMRRLRRTLERSEPS